MKTIWKYTLAIIDEQVLEMPGGATILTAQMQGRGLCLWAIVFPKRPLKQRTIRIIGTGNDMPTDMELVPIATAQMGSLVWHVFEKV